MDSTTRQAERTGDRVAQLTARRRQGDDRRALGDCRHCGRDLGVVGR